MSLPRPERIEQVEAEEAAVMYPYLEVELARIQLESAREWARKQALLKSLEAERQPVRVMIGLGLVRVGRWMAGTAGEPGTAPRRATA